ncbi:hypothetical protein Tco_1509556 [Tanacetum coccineum]
MGNNNGNDNGNGNGNDNGNGNGNDNGNGNGNDNGNGNGNGNNRGDNGDRNENHNVNGRGDRSGWSDRWSEKMETVFSHQKLEPSELMLRSIVMERADETNDRRVQGFFTMMCTKMVLKEEDRVKKFIGGLPDNIQGNVIAAET